MFRFHLISRSKRYTPCFLSFIFDDSNSNDVTYSVKPSEESSGIERLKKMYFLNEYDEMSPDMSFVSQSTLSGLFLGGCLGGFFRSKDAYVSFIERNKATAFETTLDAQNKLQSKVAIAFGRGAFEWGWRVGFFVGAFSLVSTTISVYLGKDTSLLDYLSAGAFTGALYKANLGLRAMFVGALLGGAISGIVGSLIFGFLAVTGIKFADVKNAMYQLRAMREKAYKDAVEASSNIKNDQLTRHHDQLVQSKGEVKIQEIN